MIADLGRILNTYLPSHVSCAIPNCACHQNVYFHCDIYIKSVHQRTTHIRSASYRNRRTPEIGSITDFLVAAQVDVELLSYRNTG